MVAVRGSAPRVTAYLFSIIRVHKSTVLFINIKGKTLRGFLNMAMLKKVFHEVILKSGPKLFLFWICYSCNICESC